MRSWTAESLVLPQSQSLEAEKKLKSILTNACLGVTVVSCNDIIIVNTIITITFVIVTILIVIIIILTVIIIRIIIIIIIIIIIVIIILFTCKIEYSCVCTALE